MEILKYGIMILLTVGILVILLLALKSGRPLRFLLLNAIIGIIALAIIDLTSKFTGVFIPVNQWTAGGSAVYGIPAVCGFVIVQLIFK